MTAPTPDAPAPIAHPNLVELQQTSCQRFADRPLFAEPRAGAWRWITYREFAAKVDDLRAGLVALGVVAGDRVAIVSRNSIAWATAAYATYGLGATFVPMYEAQRPDEWKYILGDCGATVVFGSTAEVVAELDAMRPELLALRHVVAIDGSADDPRSLRGVVERGRGRGVSAVQPAPGSIAGLVYTSGTTGRPKGVMLTHANLTSNIAAMASAFPIRPDDRTVSFLPWAHVYGQVCELHFLMSVGASTAFNQELDHLVDDLQEIRPTLLVAVPRIFNRIHDRVRAQIAGRARLIGALFAAGLAANERASRGERLGLLTRIIRWLADHLVLAKIRRRFGGRLRYAISASATLGPDVARFVDGLGIPVYEGYGLTETSPAISTNRPGARKVGSVGQLLPGVAVRIDATVSPTPGEGEIVVYGPNVMSGYHNQPAETARAIQADGGLRTGDLGHLDADGFLYITGRIKEQYKLENGKYVMPGPLEEQLALSPYIRTVMLYGAGHDHNVALISLDVDHIRAWAERDGVELSTDLAGDLSVRALITRELDHQSAQFRGYERPHGFVLVTDDFTIANQLLTPTLKLKRHTVLARYGAQLEAVYAEPLARATNAPGSSAASVAI